MCPMSDLDSFDDLHNAIRQRIAAGFLSFDEVIEDAVDFLADATVDIEVLRAQAESIAATLLHEHKLSERTWPAVTDCDRLRAAFASLEAQGILCRENYTCCGTCGGAEILGELEDVFADGREVSGYAFYHQQDTESAVDGSGLYLAYGAVAAGPEAAVAIGKVVAKALLEQGLTVSWDESFEMRIGVAMDWKKRIDDGRLGGARTSERTLH